MLGPSRDLQDRSGQSVHVAAMDGKTRCLGQRWLKIIWKMWQSSNLYDPELHMKNQTAHGSWLVQLNPQ